MSLNIRYILHMLLLLLFLMHHSLSAAETDPSGGIQLQLVPQSLEFESCDKSIPLLVIIRNLSKKKASDLKISSFSDVPVEPSNKPTLRTLTSGQQLLWPLTVKCTSDFVSGSLHIVLSNNIKNSEGNWSPQIYTQSVIAKLHEPQSLESIAAIDIKSTLESLRQADKGELRVLVTNKTTSPIKVTISPQMPSFIDVVPKTIGNILVDALQTASFPFSVSATGRVRPGKQLLMFHVQINTKHGTRDHFINHEVNVGVLGESEILELLGVPSLLFMPGFLVVSSFMLLWRLKWLRLDDDETRPPLEENTSGFWMVSVLVSLIIAYVSIKFRDDFFSFYGLTDLMGVWGWSLGGGCALYCCYHTFANYKTRKRLPQANDTPLQILKKLKNEGKRLLNKKVSIKGKSGQWFVLLEDNKYIYVCQPMSLSWNEGLNEELMRRMEDQLDAKGDLGILIDILEKNRNDMKLDWVGTDNQHVLKLIPSSIDESVAFEDCLILSA